MLYVEQVLPTLAANLALDEALLERVEQCGPSQEAFRIWQASEPAIVLGRSSKLDAEVHRYLADELGIPIIRRITGGATVVTSAGCMFYSVVLSLAERPHLRMLDQAHQFVMQRLLSALQPLAAHLRLDGTCDLVVEGRKVSGNSMRLLRNSLLYHGTLLLDMELSLVDRLLKHPPREPDYRRGRKHIDFLTNLNLSFATVAESLKLSWHADAPCDTLPLDRVQELVDQKYSQATWNQAL